MDHARVDSVAAHVCSQSAEATASERSALNWFGEEEAMEDHQRPPTSSKTLYRTVRWDEALHPELIYVSQLS